MSLHLEFEPHSWYMGFAIRAPEQRGNRWEAYTADGMHYTIIDFDGHTLAEVKSKIKEYRSTK